MATVSEPPRSTFKRLRALYVATAVSSFGDGIFAAAIPLAAAAVTRDPTAVAIVSAAEMMPWVAIAPFAGALVDRLPYRAVMIVSDIGRAAVLLVVAALILAGASSVPLLAAAAFLVMAGTTFFDAASQSIIPELVGRDDELMNKANGRIGSVTSVGRALLGPPTGSATFAAAHAVPFLVDALTFLGSAGCIASLKHHTERKPAEKTSLLRSIRDGMAWLAKHQVLRSLALLIALSNLTYMAAMATFVLYAQDILGVSESAFGLLVAAGAVGAMIGGLAASRVIKKLGDLRALQAAMAAQVAAWLTIALTTSAVVAGLALALAHIGTAVATVVVVSARQRLTPPEMLGRVMSSFRVLGAGVSPLGAALGGIIAAAWGLHAPLWAAGVALAITAVGASAVASKGLRPEEPSA